MNVLARTLVAAILALSAESAIAQLTTGQMMYTQRSGYWNSFLLVFPGGAYTRAVTGATTGSAVTLAFDFLPPACEPTLMLLFPMRSPTTHDVTRTDVVVSTRSDEGPRVNFAATSVATMGDTAGYISVPSGVNLLGQIGEMSRGQTLRTKVVFGHYEPDAIYNTFSLIGMTAAYRRAENLCKNPASVK